jgi:hypothetical protein
MTWATAWAEDDIDVPHAVVQVRRRAQVVHGQIGLFWRMAVAILAHFAGHGVFHGPMHDDGVKGDDDGGHDAHDDPHDKGGPKGTDIISSDANATHLTAERIKSWRPALHSKPGRQQTKKGVRGAICTTEQTERLQRIDYSLASKN